MYYEINVSKLNEKTLSYKHYFATAKRSLTSYKETLNLLNHFIELFPEPQYNIDIFHYPENGTGYNVEDFKGLNDITK